MAPVDGLCSTTMPSLVSTRAGLSSGRETFVVPLFVLMVMMIPKRDRPGTPRPCDHRPPAWRRLPLRLGGLGYRLGRLRPGRQERRLGLLEFDQVSPTPPPRGWPSTASPGRPPVPVPVPRGRSPPRVVAVAAGAGGVSTGGTGRGKLGVRARRRSASPGLKNFAMPAALARRLEPPGGVPWPSSSRPSASLVGTSYASGSCRRGVHRVVGLEQVVEAPAPGTAAPLSR